jgi:REP element-mobilizing transposase RayT
LKDYDYTQAGGYFVTMVTWKREHLFGEVVNGEMKLNDYGKVVEECWKTIPDHFPNVEIGVYAIMPNHVHGIILLGHDISCPNDDCAPTTEKFGKPVPGSIPTIVRTFKATVTRDLGRKFDISNIWQRNYYEHIIRDTNEANRIHHYIEANPANWTDDEENLGGGTIYRAPTQLPSPK